MRQTRGRGRDQRQPVAVGSRLALAPAGVGAWLPDEHQSGCTFHLGNRADALGRRDGTKRRCPTGAGSQLSRTPAVHRLPQSQTIERASHRATAAEEAKAPDQSSTTAYESCTAGAKLVLTSSHAPPRADSSANLRQSWKQDC